METVESFYLGLIGAVNAEIGTGSATCNIIDNDALTGTPAISISDPVADGTQKYERFEVRLNKPSPFTVSVSYATKAASAGVSDFSSQAGNLTFLPGQTVKIVLIGIIPDNLMEDTEVFYLDLQKPVGATLGKVRGIAQIWRNDQATVVRPSVRQVPPIANEADGYAEFVVYLSAPSAQNVSVYYTFNTRSAQRGLDFYAPDGFGSGAPATSRAIGIAPGEMVKTIRAALNDDTLVEGPETFALSLISATNAGLPPVVGGAATITDND